jgi:hypothetical protein
VDTITEIQNTSVFFVNIVLRSVIGDNMYCNVGSPRMTSHAVLDNMRVAQGTASFNCCYRRAVFTLLGCALKPRPDGTQHVNIHCNDCITSVCSAFPRLRWVNGIVSWLVILICHHSPSRHYRSVQPFGHWYLLPHARATVVVVVV